MNSNFYSFPSSSLRDPLQPSTFQYEESYIENILRQNKGKIITVYMIYGKGVENVYTGIIEAAGRDHLILSDMKTKDRYMLLLIYLGYCVFNCPILYNPLYESVT